MNKYPFEIGADMFVCGDTVHTVIVQGCVEEKTLLKAVAKILGDHGALLANDGAYCEILPIEDNVENVMIVTAHR